MSFSSVGFFAFLLVGIIVYYVLPKNIQWVWLLILSYLYYFTFSVKASLFMVFATVTIYAGGIWLESIQKKADAYLAVNKAVITKDEKKAYKEKTKKNKRWVLLLIILLDFGMLAIVKYTDFAIENINVLLGKFGAEPLSLMNLGRPKFIKLKGSAPNFPRSTLIFSIAKSVYLTMASIPKSSNIINKSTHLLFFFVFSLYAFFSSFVITALLTARYASAFFCMLSNHMPPAYIVTVANTIKSDAFTLKVK